MCLVLLNLSNATHGNTKYCVGLAGQWPGGDETLLVRMRRVLVTVRQPEAPRAAPARANNTTRWPTHKEVIVQQQQQLQLVKW